MRIAPHLIAHREEFEAALADADAMPRFEGPSAWTAVCGAFHKLDAIRGFSTREQVAYEELARRRDRSVVRARVQADMESGSVCAAFAAFRLDLPRSWPLAAWACPPERSPDGRLSLELLRILFWMGYHPGARDDDGHSALDLMLGAKRGRHCQPRAVGILLQAGADPDSIDANGDTPLLSLARSEHWCEDRDACARLLIEHGADVLATNGEDSVPALLRAAQAARPVLLRQALLAELGDALQGQ